MRQVLLDFEIEMDSINVFFRIDILNWINFEFYFVRFILMQMFNNKVYGLMNYE